MAKQAGLSAKQREDVDAALLEYGAHLTEDDHIAKGGKVMGVRLEVKGGRLRVEGGGNLLASYPVSHAGKGISDFVKAFWFWKKTPTEALRTEGSQIEHSAKKSPAQLQREIDEVLGGVSERYAKPAAASTSLKDAIAQARSKVKPGALEDAISKARVKTEQSHHRQSIWLTREGEFRVRPMSEKVSPLWFFVRDVPSEDELRAEYGR
jgi:hypothetical protein